MLQEYQRDQIVDTLRECRQILRTEDLLDEDMALEIRDSLELLGVEDADEQ